VDLAQRLADRLRALRDEEGLSQVQMAKKLGVSRSTLNRLEAASINTTVKTLGDLCRALKCDIAELFQPTPPSRPGGQRRRSR